MYTFDVFDTLITRNTATPRGIFALIQEKLKYNEKYKEISDYIKNNFYSLRIHAEELARLGFRYDDYEDITLEKIYESMSITGSLTDKEIAKLINLERQTEYENIIGIKVNIDMVKLLIEKGEKVVLISDMYLDSKTIKSLLLKVDPVFKNIRLYVSSEHLRSKWTGNLYKLVGKVEQVDYKDWTHFGDNEISDVKCAKMLGIKAEQYHYKPLMPYEKNVIENCEDDAFIQLTIGAARNTRLENMFSGPAAIGCSVGAVILYSYVWWILKESMKKGIKRLYFIARDGYVLKRIADIIIKKFEFNIETFYIYGSRKAWRMPAFSESNGDIVKLVAWSHTNNIKDISGLAEIFQIPAQEFLKFLPKGLQDEKIKMTSILLWELSRRLNANEEFKGYLRTIHKDRRKIVADYLKQEIDFSDDSFAFVDLAGGGFTQGCMADIISDFYDKKIRTFFFKLDRMNVMNNCIYYNYIPSYMYLNLIIEMLCRAPHGQTVGYKEEDGRIVPMIKDKEGDALIKHGFNEYLHGIEKYADEYSSVVKEGKIHADNLKLLLKYMEYVTKTPDKEILEFFGGMPNSVTGREKEVVEFAPVLSKKAIRSLFLWRTNEPYEEYYNGSSLDYSILRSSEAHRKKIDFYKRHHDLFLGKFVRIFKKTGKTNKKYGLASEFPCEFLGKRVVLYAAGKLGQDLYKKINHSKESRVVQWVDRDFKKYEKMGLNVVDPKHIGSVEYDNVVIGVLDEKVSESIRKALVDLGVPNEKIVWINLRPIWV